MASPRPDAVLKHQIAIKTDVRDVRSRLHRGGLGPALRQPGECACSLNLTDLHTTSTETRAVLGKGEACVLPVFDEPGGPPALPPAQHRLRQRLGVHQLAGGALVCPARH
jgi:hypothetical protein